MGTKLPVTLMVGTKQKHRLTGDADPWSPTEKHLPAPGIRWEEAGSSWYLQASFAGSRKREAPTGTPVSLQGPSHCQYNFSSVTMPWPNLRATKIFQVTLFSHPLNLLLLCYMAGKNSSSAGLFQWGGVRGPSLLWQALSLAENKIFIT